MASSAERSLMARGVTYEKDSEGMLVTGRRKNIKIRPDDSNVSNYSDVIFDEDPKTFTPDRSLHPNGRVTKWGLIDPPTPPGMESDVDFILSRMMRSGNIKQFYAISGMLAPDLQFTDVLERRKEKYIASEVVEEAKKFTFVLRIELCECEKDVWRRIKVPSGIDLSVLHDQVIVPAMGWSRGYHGYVFEDPTDGTTIGPKKYGGYIDMVHAPMRYIKLMDDNEFPLAALLKKKGDIAYYIYDLGDHWEHRLVLEEILEEEDSVELLAGEGACPPEDSIGLEEKGNENYAKFLTIFKKYPNKAKMKEAVKEVNQHAYNYRNPWMGPPITFRPLEFNISYHQILLKSMVRGPSVKKKRVHSIGDNKWKHSMEGCATCGNRLKALSQCSACKSIKYCSSECQKQHWPMHKPECKRIRKYMK